MPSPDLQLVNGAKDPACSICINRYFTAFFAVQLMAGGSMVFQRGSRRDVEFATPTFFWTERNSRYRYGPGSTGSWKHNWVTFTGDAADQFYAPLLEELAPLGWVSVGNGNALQREFDELIRLAQSPGEPATHIHQLNRVLARVEEGRQASGRPDDGLRRIKDLLDSRPEAEHDFVELARSHGFSYPNFRRLFRRRYGLPPHGYLLRCRMEKAAQLLQQTQEDIGSIGFRLGYEDPARFSKIFKQHHKMSPRAYRHASLQYCLP